MSSLTDQSAKFIRRYHRRMKLSKKIIVNAGLLKAGKSSLLNAMVGKKQFATDVIRATVENQREETDEYIFLDTPGLDAKTEDTNIALEGYADADLILFVHNIQEGEFSQTEIDSIWRIASLFGEPPYFFQSSILVLTHKDQEEEHLDETRAKIKKQCKDLFGTVFARECCVDSISYMKGLEEGKKLLIQDSGIEELKTALKELSAASGGLWCGRMRKEQQTLISEVSGQIGNLEKNMPSTDNREANLKNAKASIQQIASRAICEISQKEINVSGPRNTTYRYLGNAQNWERYQSESSAQSAGRSAISEAIGKISSFVQSDGLNYIEQVEKYVFPSGKVVEYRNYLSSRYDAMRAVAEHAGLILKTPFQVTLKRSQDSTSSILKVAWSFSQNNSSYDLDSAKNKVRWASFSSSSYYADRYSCNLIINEHEETEWVPGLFGSYLGAHDRTVTKYSYNVSGALDDVASDASDIINEAISEAKSAVYPAFKKMKDDLCEQFRQITNRIIYEMDAAIQAESNKSAALQQKASQMQNEVEELKDIRTKLTALKNEGLA